MLKYEWEKAIQCKLQILLRPGLNINKILSHLMCAGKPIGKQGSCQGDSGGPLLFQEYGKCSHFRTNGIVMKFAAIDDSY
jgi:hypothetical protein